MSEIRHRDRILEAIDQLRKRKARPDVNRICSFMFRRFAVNCIETKLDLQKLIDAEIVIKVDYKGNTSYRNAAKWAMLPSYKYKKEIDTSSLISSAVAELVVLEPDYLDIGVPQSELEAHMIQKDSKRFSKKNIELILKREVEIGSLVKLENGNYFIGEHLPKNSNSTMSRPSASNVGTSASATAGPNTSNVAPKPKASDSSPKQTSPSPKQNKPKSPVKHNDNSNDSDNVKSEDIKMKNDDSLNNSSNESNNAGFSRVGGRQKRARVVFDPSDNNIPTRVIKKRGPGRPMGSLNKSTLLAQTSNNNSNNNSSNNGSVSSSRSTTPTPTSAGGGAATQSASRSRPTSPAGGAPRSISPRRSSVTTGSQAKPFNKNFDLGSTPPVNPNLCSICHSYGIRIKGVPERLVACSDCTRPTRAHPSCLENSTEGSWSCDRDGTWKCGNCKTCRVCDETSQAGNLVVCVVCRDAYHHQCHSPPVPERPRQKLVVWYCAFCRPSPPPPTPDSAPAPPPQPSPAQPPARESTVRESTSMKEAPSPARRDSGSFIVAAPVSASAPAPADCRQDPFQDIPIDESIPDAKHWSTNQVYQYFSTQMKPEIAQAFKEQDIDGQALLLMKRMDILTGLSLKLGPALKVYGHVRKLQTRKSHLRILWS